MGERSAAQKRQKVFAALVSQTGYAPVAAEEVYNELHVFKHSIEEMDVNERKAWPALKAMGLSETDYLRFSKLVETGREHEGSQNGENHHKQPEKQHVQYGRKAPQREQASLPLNIADQVRQVETTVFHLKERKSND